MKSKTLRALTIAIILGICAYVLYPSIQWYFLISPSEIAKYDKTAPELAKKKVELDKVVDQLRRLVPSKRKQKIQQQDYSIIPPTLKHPLVKIIFFSLLVLLIFLWYNQKISNKVGLPIFSIFVLIIILFIVIKEDKTKYTLNIKPDAGTQSNPYIIDLSDSETLLNKALGKQANSKKDRFLTLAKKANQIMDELDESKKLKNRRKAIVKLGLDLAGGTHLTLKVDKNEVIKKLHELYEPQLKDKNIIADIKSEDPKISGDALQKEILIRKARIQKEYTRRLKEDPEGARERALDVIRNRINEFGVSEPRLSKGLGDTIFVELPRLNKKHVEETKKTITQAGELNFQIVNEEIMQKIKTLHSKYFNYKSGYLYHSISVKEVKKELKEAGISWSDSDLYPVEGGDEYGNPIRKGYLALRNKVEVEGKLLSDSHTGSDEQGRPAIFFSFNSEGARKMGKTTAKHVSKEINGRETNPNAARLAIVLDKKIKSAPGINGIITSRGQITGNFTVEEVTRIVAFLKAGVLPGQLKIPSEMTLGATLGKENIKAGLYAVVIGMLAVIIFMIVYYKLAGAIAVIALILNLYLLLAILSAFGFTMTLPGIAGIILTIGMAVDANVIIFERMREEIKDGKTRHAAIDGAYEKAFSAIFDSNLTTILAAFILSYIGSGIIKGFGFTLMIGIICSMFTALFVTRLIFDFLTDIFRLEKLYV